MKIQRKVWAGLGVATGVVALGAVVSVSLLSPSDEPGPRTLEQGISAIAPADAYTVMVAPASDHWWESANGMMPDVGLRSVSLEGAPADLRAVGYLEFPGSSDGVDPSAHRVLAIDAGTEDAAQEVARWIDALPGTESRTGSVVGGVVTVTDTAHSLDGAAGGWQVPSGFSPTEERGSMWMDLEGWSKGSADEEVAQLSSKVLRNALGFIAGSSVSLSSDDGKLWSGPWLSGGFDGDQVDFIQAGDVLSEAVERTQISDGGGAGSAVEIVSGAGQDMLAGSLFTDHVKGVTLGSLETSAVIPEGATGAFGDVVAVWDTRALRSSLAGAEWQLEGSRYMGIGLSPEGATVSFH